jgi:hypothetical protein
MKISQAGSHDSPLINCRMQPIPMTKASMEPETVEIREEQINLALKAHQDNVENWAKRALMEDLHVWAERFTLEFKLQTCVPALMLDRLSRRCCGHFRRGRNGFGLLNEIAINEMHVSKSRYWDVLVTLLHELLHAEQEIGGKPGRGNYHNKEFRERARALGLIVDHWGHTWVASKPTPFLDILEKYGLTVPEITEPAPAMVTSPGTSKLKLWVCQCTPNPVRVRVAIEDFQARCLKCGHVFVRSD